MKEVLAPHRVVSEAGLPETTSCAYMKRGEKTAEFQQERWEITDKGEHEHKQKMERKRSRSAGKVIDSSGRTGRRTFRSEGDPFAGHLPSDVDRSDFLH